MKLVTFEPSERRGIMPTISIHHNGKDYSYILLLNGEPQVETFHASFADCLRQAASTMDSYPKSITWWVEQ